VFVGGVRLEVWGVVLVVCVCFWGVVLSRRVCMCDLLIFLQVSDMKHFGFSANNSLDEKEKLEARLKRGQFDSGHEQVRDRTLLYIYIYTHIYRCVCMCVCM